MNSAGPSRVPSRPTSRNSLKSNLSAQLSGLFSRGSAETNERSPLVPSSAQGRDEDGVSHSRLSSDNRAGGSTEGGSLGGIRRNYTQEMDTEEDEEDGKIPTAARSPKSDFNLSLFSQGSKR